MGHVDRPTLTGSLVDAIAYFAHFGSLPQNASFMCFFFDFQGFPREALKVQCTVVHVPGVSLA